MTSSSARTIDAESGITVDQLSMRAGERRQNASSMLVQDTTRSRAARTRGMLCLLIEAPSGSTVPDSTLAELADEVSETYQGMGGSVTRSLRAALLSANESLTDANLSADADQRILVGLGSVLVRGTEAYVSQIGPSLVVHVREGQVSRYPQASVWHQAQPPDAYSEGLEPLAGMRSDVEPELFHVDLEPGDVLLLATSALAGWATDDELFDAVMLRGDRTVLDGLGSLAEGHDLDAIVIEYQREPIATDDAGASPRSRLIRRPALRRGGSLQEEPVSGQVGVDQSQDSSSALDEEPDDRPTDRGAVVDVLAREGSPAQHAEDPSKPDLGQLRESIGSSSRRLRQGTEGLIRRMLPDSVPEGPDGPDGPPETPQELSLSGKALVLISLIIPLVMLFMVVMTRIQYERTRKEHFGSLQSLAQVRFDAAMRRENPVYVREGLHEAMLTVSEGLAVMPSDDLLNDIRRRIAHKLDETDSVERFYHLWKLVTLTDEPTSPIDSSRIIISGTDVFVLNRGSDSLFKFLLNEVGDAFQTADGTSTLMRKGDVYGGIQIGDLVDTAWMEEGGQRIASGFVALERTGSLLAYDPKEGIEALPVADSGIWLKPQAIGGYYGNLYVLDPLLGRILKYVPTDDAYTNAPSDYLSPELDVDLTGAVDMAIDGNIYVLFADGTIKKFMNGEPQPFEVRGVPSPMRGPTTLFVSGAQDPEAVGYLYVTDSGNDRIIQLDKSGQYIRQFRDKLGENRLDALRGIYVDEDTKRMFILSGNALWLANVPLWDSR